MRDTAFLNNIIDAVADPILVKDSRLRFVLVNQALCDFTGIPRERFIGATVANERASKQTEDLLWIEAACAVYHVLDEDIGHSTSPQELS